MSWSPFALDAYETRAELKDHVVASAFSHRRVHAHSELDRRMNDRRLGDRPFLIAREHVVEVSNGVGWAVSSLDNLR